jgi:glucokinase
MTLLAGDIGGTKTLLQLFENHQDGFKVLYEQRYISNNYDNLLAMVEEFLSNAKDILSLESLPINKACFGIAGPIQGNIARVTNLPWVINADELQLALAIEKVFLINDFKAIAYALKVLTEDNFTILQAGKQQLHAPKVILGAGTGLGSAFLFHTGKQYEIFSSESSHAAFAPINSLQIELLKFLRKKYQQVSYEHIVSGPGLVNIFEFLCSIENNHISNELSEALTTMDQSAAISQFALSKTDIVAIQAVDIFTQVYARQAANLALTSLAYGGVYIAGGIAPKIIEKLKEPEFLEHFKNNTSMGYLLDDMPLKVLMNPNAGLIGAAVVAAS